MKSFVLTLAVACLLGALTQTASAAGPFPGQFGMNNPNQNFGIANVQAVRQDGVITPVGYHHGHSHSSYRALPYGYYGNGYYRRGYAAYGNPWASFAPAGAFGFGPGAVFGW